MAQTEWWAQYKRPEWQKKRLECLQAANWKCSSCHEKNEELHVHHKMYLKGRKPWEYELTQLEVLCNDCHEEAERQRLELRELLSHVDLGKTEIVISLIAGFVGKKFDQLPSGDIYGHSLGVLARNADEMLSMSEIWDLSVAVKKGAHGKV